MALHLFARDGYEAVSVSQIVGELDMTIEQFRSEEMQNLYQQ